MAIRDLTRQRMISGGGLKARLIRGATGSFALKLAFIGLGFAVSVLLARLLGPSGYGLYEYCLTIGSLLSIPAGFGLRPLLVREIASDQVNARWHRMRGLMSFGGKLTVAVSLGLTSAAAAVAWGLRGRLSEEALHTFWLALAVVPLLAGVRLLRAALAGLRHAVLGQVPEMLLRFGGLVLAVLLFVAIAGAAAVTPPIAMALHVGALAVAVAVGAVLLLGRLPAEARAARPEIHAKAWLASAMPFMLISGMQIINSRADILMLGALRSSDEVGIYRVAVQMAMLVAFPLQAMGAIVAPEFARLWAQGDRSRLQRLAVWSARLVLALALPAAVLFIASGEQLLSFIFGVAFVAAALPLAALCFGQLVNATAGCVGQLLNATGHERAAAIAVGLAAAVNVCLNAALIPPFGMLGASLATGASMVIWNSHMVYTVHHRLGLKPSAFGRVKRVEQAR